MRLRRLAVTLAACCLQVRPAAADESINIFVAIDDPGPDRDGKHVSLMGGFYLGNLEIR